MPDQPKSEPIDTETARRAVRRALEDGTFHRHFEGVLSCGECGAATLNTIPSGHANAPDGSPCDVEILERFAHGF